MDVTIVVLNAHMCHQISQGAQLSKDTQCIEGVLETALFLAFSCDVLGNVYSSL